MQRITCPSLLVEFVRSAKLLHAERDHQAAAGESQALTVDRAADAANKASSDQKQRAETAHGLSGLEFRLVEGFLQRLELAGTQFGGVVEPELFDRGTRNVRGIGEFKNPPAGKLLELGAERLYGSDWLIHLRIVIQKRIDAK